MHSRPSTLAVAAASLLGALVAFFPGTAHATVLDQCGNIDLSGSESCTLETSGGCTADCTPVNFQLQCTANLEVQCSGTCNLSVTADCTTNCQASCTGGCTADPGSFSCEGSCEGDCSGSCSSECSSDANQDQCTASCKATCDGECQGSCQGTPPSASCDTQCQASCQGECQASANLDCNVKCQEQGSADCEANLTGGCQAQCSQPTGALYCNGQYVDVGNDLQSCLDQLASELDINVSVSGEGSCSGNNCSATGQASASCGQIAPGAMPPITESVFGLVFGVGILGAVRRRARKNAKK